MDKKLVYTVYKIKLMSTIFIQGDGTLTYMSNEILSTKNIYNINRSKLQSETITLNISAATPTISIFKLKDAIAEYLKEFHKDFTGNLTMGDLSVADSTKMKVDFSIEYKGNFQNSAEKTERHNRLMLFIKDKIEEFGIEYALSEEQIIDRQSE